MNNTILIKMIGLLVSVVLFSFAAGCGAKTPGDTTHIESGSLSLIVNEIYNDCVDCKDIEGAEEVLDTHLNLCAFYCEPWTEVTYDDIKNRNYENIPLQVGDLQIAVAAYNEYNAVSATDVDVVWICQYNSCTEEQQDAIASYVHWYHKAQNGNKVRTIDSYRHDFGQAYNIMCFEYDLIAIPGYDRLSPAQFEEVQKYMKDPSYRPDMTLWESVSDSDE